MVAGLGTDQGDKIIVNPDKNVGANHLFLDPDAIIVASQHKRIVA